MRNRNYNYHRRRKSDGKSAKRKTNHYNKPAKVEKSPWYWLILGLLMGCLIPLVFHNKGQTDEKASHHSERDFSELKLPKPVISKSEKKILTSHEKADDLPHYDFYTMLSTDNVSASSESDTSTNKATQRFSLEVAHFKDAAAADALRAELIIEGFTAHLTKNQKGESVVVIGPFATLKKAESAQKRLKEMKLSAQLISE